MNDPFLAFEHNPDTEESEKILAAGFDWDDLERRLETEVDPKKVIAEARAEGAREMLSKLIEVCADDVTKIQIRKQRAGSVGARFICFVLMLRPGHISDKGRAKIASMLGMTQQHVSAVMRRIKPFISERYE